MGVGRPLRNAACAGLLLALAAVSPQAFAAEKPKVRAVTAFLRLDRAHYQTQIHDTLDFLRQAKAEFEKAGYEVQTIRISTQPFPEYTRGLSRAQALAFFHEYDQLAAKENFIAAIGPAMLTDADDPTQAELLGEVLKANPNLDASLVVAGEDGVHWRAVRAAARLMKFLAEESAHSQGNFHFAASSMVPEGTPFFPASYHRGAGHSFAVALESANVVQEALASAPGDPAGARQALLTSLGAHARAIEAVALGIEKQSGWGYGGMDLSPAPLKDVSIGAALESFTGHRVGASGTMSAAALITAALRDIPVKHAGYSGLMLPVLEDSTLARRWSEGALTLDSLLAYSAVCGTGLDTIPLPGDVTEDQLARIIGDMASLSVKWHKPLSARLLPVKGKKAGEKSAFDDPYLVNATLQPLP
ncbi:MAG: DUF711 family protein [Acidobacteriota bacterium]|nr:DUF711 family protein [Acidobacteriota bacterium]